MENAIDYRTAKISFLVMSHNSYSWRREWLRTLVVPPIPIFAILTQLVEYKIRNFEVVGSIPTNGLKNTSIFRFALVY